MRYFEGHGRFVQTVAFSPDGQHLASGSADGSVRLWDVLSGGEVAALQPWEREEWIGAVAFAPDGRALAIGTYEGGLHLWDVASRKQAQRRMWQERGGGQGRLTSLSFSPDGQRLVWGGYLGGGALALNGEAGPGAFRDGTGLIYDLSVAPDGRTFATGGTSSELFIRRLSGGQEVRRLAHGDRQGCWSLAYAPDGRTLAAALGGGVQLWDVATGKRRGEVTDHRDVVSGVAFSPDGGRLLTCGWDGAARLYAFDQGSGAVVREVGRYDWKLGPLFDVAVSPDGTLAAAGGSEAPYLVVWDVE